MNIKINKFINYENIQNLKRFNYFLKTFKLMM